MKSKKSIITLIVLLSIIVIGLLVFMVLILNGKLKFSFNHKVSNKLVLDETYDNIFHKIDIVANASDIYIKSTDKEQVRVVIYSDEDNTAISTTNNELSINSQEKNNYFFGFNRTIAKIEVYLPSNYEKNIKLVNNYGNIEVDKFLDANIDIEEDCGDVTVLGGNKVNISNDYGNITLKQAVEANIKESAGDVIVESVNDITVQNSFGDIKITNVYNYLNVSQDCGDVKINNIVLNKNSNIKNDYGDIEIGNTNEIYIDAATDLGSVKINKNYQKSEVTLKIENDCGNITVNN